MKRQKAVEKDWILRCSPEHFVIKEVEELSTSQAIRLVSLFKNGCENAYIARYREDVHGGLAPDKIRKANDAYFNAVHLNAKVSSATVTIPAKIVGANEKKAVTERLKQCEDFEELADITKEFATGARKTKASLARELGLEPPALLILEGNPVDFASYLSKDLKTKKNVEEHLKICLADLINRDVDVRKMALQVGKLETNCSLQVTARLTKDAAKKKQELENKNVLQKYKEYIGNTWRAKTIRDHQISALNRGSEEGIVSWKIDCSIEDAMRIHPFSQKKVHFLMRNFFNEALSYSVKNYFIPMLERSTKKFLTRRSEARAILIFGENVEQLFSQEGVHSKYVIALDPGTTVKTAFLEPSGKVISMNQFLIRGSTFENRGITLLKEWSSQTGGKDLVFAIGNGSNSHNTQAAVSKMIANKDFPIEISVCFCVVPEHGASKYSCTTAALEEFGEDAEIKQISAVSIGRRLIDPMSEYVKIEPQHLGKGQYQLSIDDKLLKEKLVAVVRDRVSLIGVDLNIASEPLLKNICGLNQATAAEIVKYREKNERFISREELKKVKGIGDITFQQCAGFLTVSCPKQTHDGPAAKRFKKSADAPEWSPLDDTIVHPEDYEAAMILLDKLGLRVEEITGGADTSSANLTDNELKILMLLRSKPKLKPPPPMMKKARALKDLAVGQQYTGVVANKTDFGVFVDIGVERDGLVHISCFRKNGRNVPQTFGRKGASEPKYDTLEDVPSVGDILEVIVRELRGDKISLEPSRLL